MILQTINYYYWIIAIYSNTKIVSFSLIIFALFVQFQMDLRTSVTHIVIDVSLYHV